ncbi:MAG TPA: IS1595 family transposase [Verrucomicrobiae bacterium]|nr:IS1595 family transposase [Verrucomicrobiae bacterium]
MKTKTEFPETLTEAIKYFADDDRSLEFMTAVRWPDGKVCCPRCQSANTVLMAARRLYRCRDCQKQFSVKVGTIFEDSPLGLDKWLPAFWMILNSKNGISSCELGRALGVTQKTAWFMLHRIRLAIQDGSICKFAGNVEVDETFIGGKARNMHKGQRKAKGTGPVAMTPVMGLLERNTPEKSSRVILNVVRNVRRGELQEHIRKNVVKGSEVHTDALRSYNGLAPDYVHNVIDHAVAYVRGHVHTNGMENFWSLLKRTVRGTYVSVEPFHLFRYLDEQAFRFNERKNTDAGRFLLGIVGVIGKRIQYSRLIGQRGSVVLPA